MDGQKKALLWIIPLIAVGALGIIFFSLQMPQAEKTMAPDFTAKTIEGKTISLSGMRGKPIFLYFGASW